MINTITVNGLTLGTIASGYLLGNNDGFGYPESRVVIKNKGSYHGADLNFYKYGKRVFGIEGEIIASSVSDFESKRQALSKALDLYGGLVTMTFTLKSGLVVTSDVIVNSEVDLPYNKGAMIMCPFRLQLTAPYPFLKGNTENTETVSLYSGGGGTIPFAVPFSLGVGGSGVTTITNDGNGLAFPTYKIYGVVENPSVQNTTRSEQFSLTYTLNTTSDYIEIDTYNRTVLLNGITNIKQYFSGDWVLLSSGDNDLKLTSSGGSDNGTLDVVYYDHYLSV